MGHYVWVEDGEYPDPYDEEYELEGCEREDADEEHWECLYPDECCMAYTDHCESECYTAEDVERDMAEGQI